LQLSHLQIEFVLEVLFGLCSFSVDRPPIASQSTRAV
jgi:hypothetical protein